MEVLIPRAGLPLLSDYSRFANRQRARIAACTVLGLAAGLVWALLQPSTHSATASVLLPPVPVYVMPSVDELPPPEVTIDTDAQLLGSPQVLAAVAEALGTDATQAADALTVTASAQTSVLHVTVSAGGATEAAVAANAAVDALVDVRRRSLGSLQGEQLRQLQFLALDQERLLARAQARRIVVPVRDELFQRVLAVRSRVAELESARQVPAEVVEPARAPTTPDHSNDEVPLTSGAMLGLLSGCLAGAARDRSLHVPHPTEENVHAA
jgi:uncharacterized protein involved in exopolysaccharide biosynthesis